MAESPKMYPRGKRNPSRFPAFFIFLGFVVLFLFFSSSLKDTKIQTLSYSDFISYSKGLYQVSVNSNNPKTPDTVHIMQLERQGTDEEIYKEVNGDTVIKLTHETKSNYKISPYKKIIKVNLRSPNNVDGEFIDDTSIKPYIAIIPNNTIILDEISQYPDINVKVIPDTGGGILGSFLSFLPWLFIFLFFWYFLMKQMGSSGNKAFNFVKSNAKRYNPDAEGKVTFKDIAGYEEAKTELAEIVDFLKKPDKYQKLGAKIPKGVLLSGAPGTGKTLFAQAVAGEAERPFFSISGSEFVELFVGVAASRVRDLFNNAKKVAPSIIFIDEMDAIGRMRGVGNGGGNDEKEQALNQILVEMDGFGKDTNVIVLAATNRPDVLDPALLRPGRFDRQIRFENPSPEDRLLILQLHAKNKPIDPKIDFTQISQDISGFSGAEIANLINEALLISARKNKPFADAEDIKEAQEKVTKQKNNLASEPPTFFGRSKAKFFDATSKPSTTFKDVAGVYEAKEELVEVIDFLKKPEKYKALGARIPKGILLTGSPGTGKTLLAKAVAGEAQRPFFSVSGSDFIEMYVGVGASRVRDLFDNAKKNAPCIVFIDEIDAIGKKRGSNFGGGNDERDNTLNQILVEMDGFNTNDTVIILASTNRADVLDPALLRPGRFDRQVSVDRPDLKAREDILRVHARNKPLSPDVKLENIARVTTGFSGAELANLLNEAALLTARENRTEITPTDIDNAKDKVLMGPEKRNMLQLQKDKINTAYHEAAHAIVAHYLSATDPVYKVTIVPRGRALGVTQQIPIDDKQGYTKTYMLNRIAILMAGRIGEEIRFGKDEITTGASNDITVATQMAQRYVTEFGMSDKLGMVHWEQNSYEGKSYSQETAKAIDDEIRSIIDTQYKTAYELLKTHHNKLEKMSTMLLERETIDEDDVIALLGIKPGVAELRAEVDLEYNKLIERQIARGIHPESSNQEKPKEESVIAE